MDELLPPGGPPLDAATVFQRCQAAAMDDAVPGYSYLSGSEREAAVDDAIAASLADGDAAELATDCIERLCTAVLVALLDSGVKPGDVSRHTFAHGGTSLLAQGIMAFSSPYVQSPVALPHALASLRVLLARAQASDWLVATGSIGRVLPLNALAFVGCPVAPQAILDAIVESPGGFPAHAVATSPTILHPALQHSTPAFVKALLAAGADPLAQYRVATIGDERATAYYSPVHSLALLNPNCDPVDFRDKLRLLLDAGAELEATTTGSRTALLLAALNQNAAAFDALLAAGAQTSALCVNIGPSVAESLTVLHQLAFWNNAELITRIAATGAMSVDKRAGAAPGSCSCTPLQYAALHDAPRAVAALLAAGASITATDAAGCDALTTAVRRSSAKAARPLVDATPRTRRARYKRQAAGCVVFRSSELAANRADTDAVAALADARAIVALLA